MRESQKKAKKTQFNIKTLFALALIVYFSIAIVGQQSALNGLNNTINEYNTKIEDKKGELAALEEKKKAGVTDDTIETIARERLGLVRSDETVFVDVTGN